MAVTIEDIKKLRHLTSAGLSDCKAALTETNGDMDAAVEILRQKGKAIAAKREDRQASEGCVLADVKDNFAAIVALNCETDFVAKNATFVELTKKLLALALDNKVKSIDELKAISPVFEEDVFDAISMETCVSTRCTVGAPSKTSMDKVIAVYDEYMKSNWQDEV